MEELKKLKLPSHTSVVDIKQCTGNDELMKQLDTVLLSGGEGIICYETIFTLRTRKNKILSKSEGNKN